MTKRTDATVTNSDDAGEQSPTAQAPETPLEKSTAAHVSRRGETAGARRRPDSSGESPSGPDAVDAGDGSTDGSARPGVVASGTTEWATLADPSAVAPGGTYSTGVIGHGADIGVLGTDNGTGTGVGVLGTVTNPGNSQPAIYGFTQGSGPGVQGESDGSGPGVLGTDNATGAGSGVVGELTNPRNTKPAVFGTTAGTGAGVEGDSKGIGPGVFGFGEGSGPGVRGVSVGTNPGVEGQSSGTGAGVLALNDGSGPALEVQGPVTFSRSGLATIAAKKTTVEVSFPGVTATSMVLATMQTAAKGVAVGSVVPDADSFTIKLTKAPKVAVRVAWFVMGS